FHETLKHERLPAAGDELENGFRVRSGLEDGSVAYEFIAKSDGIGEVAIMRHRKSAAPKVGKERLHITQNRLARGRVAAMADGPFPRHSVAHLGGGEMASHAPKSPFRMEMLAIIGNDARCLLTAMLKRMQAKRRQGRRIGMTENAEDAAFFAEPVI